MRNNLNRQTRLALKKARRAMNKGNRMEARKIILSALEVDPVHESLWLMMAELASDKAKMGYLKKALEVNPTSQSARQAIHDLIARDRQSKNDNEVRHDQIQNRTDTAQNGHEKDEKRKKTNFHFDIHNSAWSPYITFLLNFAGFSFILLLFTVAFLIWFAFSNDIIVLANAPMVQRPADILFKPTLTATTGFSATLTDTPVPTLTVTPTATHTLAASDTPTIPTASPDPSTPDVSEKEIASQAATVEPAAEPVKNVLLLTETARQFEDPVVVLPSGIAPDEKWIDINLSNQQLSAFIGNENIRSFTVSTGTSYTPTPAGLFHIYVKYPSADMYGPGYYLPGVPSVMYFNKDYGIHGAYWHMNFGTPMSHGCVNMKLEDAAWLFDWSSVGTAVNIQH